MTVTREIPHGTASGYSHFGCRCAGCKAARAAYQRAHGGNRRVGRRAEQKRRADEKLKHPCENGCGRLVWREHHVCRPCYEAELLASRQKVERLWAAGLSTREIGREMGWTMAKPSAHISVLRARGYDLPLRRLLSAEHRAKNTESMKRARAAWGKALA